MKKMLDMVVVENMQLNRNYHLLKLTSVDNSPLPEMLPGQFVEVEVKDSVKTFLRRPISINFFDKENNRLWLLVQKIGAGTRKMGEYKPEDIVNIILPLGNSFSIPNLSVDEARVLLVGGGVGIAPLLYWGAILKEKGYKPTFLLGARSKDDLLQLDDFCKFGDLFCTTEDASHGEKGYVTDHSICKDISTFTHIYTCGPKPMMMAVARYAHRESIECEASLENTMACGIGACLCCVENTRKGNICVCTEGPVFNIKDLKWID